MKELHVEKVYDMLNIMSRELTRALSNDLYVEMKLELKVPLTNEVVTGMIFVELDIPIL